MRGHGLATEGDLHDGDFRTHRASGLLVAAQWRGMALLCPSGHAGAHHRAHSAVPTPERHVSRPAIGDTSRDARSENGFEVPFAPLTRWSARSVVRCRFRSLGLVDHVVEDSEGVLDGLVVGHLRAGLERGVVLVWSVDRACVFDGGLDPPALPRPTRATATTPETSRSRHRHSSQYRKSGTRTGVIPRPRAETPGRHHSDPSQRSDPARSATASLS